MVKESLPSPGRTESERRRVLGSVGIGAAVAASGVAIIAAIVMRVVRSPRDFISHSLTTLAVVASVAGVSALILVGTWLLRRHPVLRRLRIAAGFTAAGMAVWCGWNLVDLYKSRDALRFVDSAGAAVVAAGAGIAAIVGAVLAVVTVAFAGTVSGRAVLCALLVVSLVAPPSMYWAVQKYRAGVWQPELTVEASAPAPTPDTIGPVGYRIALEGPEYQLLETYVAGNGFIADTRRELTAYDGSTGAPRWRIGDYAGTSGRILVVHRDHADATGIVVVFLYYGLIAFDGSSGEVLWRRQLGGGRVTAATGSVDALGMAVFTGDYTNDGHDGTHLYSLDPATGRVRWDRTISCSSPTLTSGTPGQFGYGCGKPAILDAHTGDTIEVPGNYTPRAGADAYVVATPRPEKDLKPTEATRVMNPDGQVIDEVPGTYPVSVPHNGIVLVYGGGGNTWLLRDYRNHRSTPVSIHYDLGAGLDDVETIWLDDKLLIVDRFGRDRMFQMLDLTRLADAPVIVESPCPDRGYVRSVHAVAGAIVVHCTGTDVVEVVGLVPEQ